VVVPPGEPRRARKALVRQQRNLLDVGLAMTERRAAPTAPATQTATAEEAPRTVAGRRELLDARARPTVWKPQAPRAA
jgi:hypothetical protein